MAGRRVVSVALWAAVVCAGAPVVHAQGAGGGSKGGVDAGEKVLLGAEGLLARGQFDLARQEFDSFLKQYPNDPRDVRVRYGRGVAEFNLNDTAGALGDLKAVVGEKSFAKRDEAMVLLGTVELQTGQVQPALETFDALVKEYPKSKQVESAEVNRAQGLYRLKEYGKSLEAVRDLLKQFPGTTYRGAALYVGALDQRGLGDDVEAGRTLEAIISGYPNSPFYYNAELMLGEVLAGQGKFDDAIKHYQKMEGDAPASEKPAIRFGLATAYLQAGKFPQAEEAFGKIVKEFPSTPYAAPAALQQGVAQVKSGRLEEARGTLAAVERAYPAQINSVAYWLARCDLLDNKFDAAARQLERVVGTDIPEEGDAEFDLAYCELRLGHEKAALQRLEGFRKKYPRSAHVWEAVYYEASALYQLGEYNKAVEFAAASEKASQGTVSRESTLLKGESLLMAGEYGKAAGVFEGLMKSSTDAMERLRLAFRLGQCAYFSGDYQGAEKELAEVVGNPAGRRDPALGEAGFLLGDSELQLKEYEKAAGTLKGYLASDAPGKREEAEYKLATAQQALHDTMGATQTLDGLMQGDLKSPWVQRAWYDAARIAFENKDAEGAGRELERLLAGKEGAGPAEEIAAPALYLLAQVESAQGKFAEAAVHLEQLIQAYPHDALAQEAMYARGVALKDGKQFEGAEKAFAAYLQQYPNGKFATEARHQRAVALAGTNDPGEAVKILADLAGNPATRNGSVLYDLAWAYRNNKQVGKGVEAYEALVKEYPKAAEATPGRVELAQLLYAQKKYAEAKGLLAEALSDSKMEPHLHAVAMYWMASCEAALGDASDAAATFDRFARENPKDPLAPQAISEAGDAYAALQEFAKAAARQQQVLKEYGDSDEARLAQVRLGETQNQAGDYAAAEKTMRDFLEKEPKSALAPRAEFGVGWSLENRQKYAQAREWYGKVIAADNGETAARAQFQTGETYFAQKEYASAAKEYLKVDILYAAPEWAARALYEAGRAFQELHEPGKAREQFEMCVKKYPESDVASLAKKQLAALGGGPGGKS